MLEPWIFFSQRRSAPSISIFWPTGIMPMMVAVPPQASISYACSAVVLVPIASNEKWTPPPVSSLTCPTGSPSAALTTSVAPNRLARLSLDPTVSTAMIRPAPAMAAPLMQDSPIPPQPITTTVLPTSTLAVLCTAPTPVVTAQPIKAALSSGMSLRIFTRACSWARICSANDDKSKN